MQIGFINKLRLFLRKPTELTPAMVFGKSRLVFAWWPMRISEYREPHWVVLNSVAWLEWVERTDTIWGETFYRRIKCGDGKDRFMSF